MAKTNNTTFSPNIDVKPEHNNWLPTDSVFNDMVKNQKEIMDQLRDLNFNIVSVLKQIEKNTFKGY